MQTILIVEDDENLAIGLSEMLECPGRRQILCADIESARLIIEQAPPDCVVTDVRLTGPFRYEGLDFISEVKKLSADIPVIVITAARTPELEVEALNRGAAVLFGKPFAVARLAAHIPEPADTGESSIVRVPSLDAVIASPLLVPAFQPIIDLAAADPGTAYGYESLARFPGVLFSNPALLFEYAFRRGRLVDLESACVRATLLHGAPLAEGARLFINVHPLVLASEAFGANLAAAVSRFGIPATRIVLEITEQSSLGSPAMVELRCGALREAGFSFALDDVGMAYSHLPHIERIRPAYLKVSQDFGTAFESDPTRTKIVRNVLALANDFGCELIIEGIESQATCDAARNLGIHFGQGFFFARPAPAANFAR